MKKPNFLILGAPRAGTTSLYSYLNQHPEIYMSPRKECNFFTMEGEIPTFKGPGDESINQSAITDIETYYSYFRGVTNEIAIGEASTWYLYDPKVPHRIKKHIPKAKLIAILRNPVDRAYSHFLRNIRYRNEPLTSIDQAFQKEQNRIRDNWAPNWHYKQMGFYYLQLKRYFTLFEKKQIRIYLYEDFKFDPIYMLQDTFRFLEVDDNFIPDISYQQNISGVYKNKLLHTLSKTSLIKSVLKKLIPDELQKNIKYNSLVKPELTLEMKKQLIEEYRTDITKLEKLISRDLSIWFEDDRI